MPPLVYTVTTPSGSITYGAGAFPTLIGDSLAIHDSTGHLIAAFSPPFQVTSEAGPA